MLNLFKRRKPPVAPAAKKPITAKVFIIDPVTQSITAVDNPHIPSLIDEIVGVDADCFKLDSHDNVTWLSDIDTNNRFGYYWEGMDYPFNVRRYSKALVVSLGPRFWDAETITDWIRWHDKLNPWEDV